ncbi:polysaccharide lyase family 7 protein [Neolewinella persica]|uniref:polysaccharide lyase family 7 protein n=1 Tax=Neolewinella persica TaxID=70998 RepID=UPI0003AA24B2|nr:polysaccharide lyase family 7 protein [Neolewinella persica]
MSTSSNLMLLIVLCLTLISCGDNTPPETENTKENAITHPSDLMPSIDQWGILLGNGESIKDLAGFSHEDYFYHVNDGTDWVVYKTPNGGVTSPNSHNTRTELGQKKANRWVPETGGKLTGTLKVTHVSTSGDARVAASFSVVVGQIHSDSGHENEPLKIFYKKFPGHAKGSVFWNYEINTAGDDNAGRWDFSTAVWGYDMAKIGADSTDFPAEPEDGIELGEEFSYEVNVYKGIMYLTFTSDGHATKEFTKDLTASDYVNKSDLPQQVITQFVSIGQDGTERPEAYAGETQFFKQGAYNQTNGRSPSTNMVWSTGGNTYDGNLEKQYANGDYAEVWFREFSVGPGVAPR